MKRARVLLADDHADVAKQLRFILETEFDVVAVVGDGSALLAAASGLEPDVIVTDIAMPGMDGSSPPPKSCAALRTRESLSSPAR